MQLSSYLLSETLQYPQKLPQGNFLTKHEGVWAETEVQHLKSEDNFQYILQTRGSKNVGRQPVPVGSHWWTHSLKEINGVRESIRSLLQAEMAQLMHDCQTEHCSTQQIKYTCSNKLPRLCSKQLMDLKEQKVNSIIQNYIRTARAWHFNKQTLLKLFAG